MEQLSSRYHCIVSLRRLIITITIIIIRLNGLSASGTPIELRGMLVIGSIIVIQVEVQYLHRYAQASWWVEWFVNKLSHIIGSWMCGEEADLRSHITIGNVINLPSDVGLRMRYFCNKNNTVQH